MLYIHVPFCAQRCIYCDFYSTTKGAEMRRLYVEALCAEISQRADELPAQQISTVYLGGGTPSLLSSSEFEAVFTAIHQTFTLDADAEVTVESNPDDITPEYIAMLRSLGVNRLSMGVQSFNPKQLAFLRRRHTAEQALEAVEHAMGGITNVSIDLIYGLPHQTLEDWCKDLATAFALPITHLSAYSLIYEEGTPLYRLRAKGMVEEAEEGLSYAMYEALLDAAEQAGWEHYEISNFSQHGFRSRHNSAYWQERPYVGCGPAAHSFNGKERRFNLPSIDEYIQHIGNPPHEIERLTLAERLNERLLTALRTSDGLDLAQLAQDFGTDASARILRLAHPHLRDGRLQQKGTRLALSRQGFFVSDDVISDLMEV